MKLRPFLKYSVVFVMGLVVGLIFGLPLAQRYREYVDEGLARAYLGQAFEKEETGDDTGAAMCLFRSQVLDPNAYASYLESAVLFEKMGCTDLALAWLQEAEKRFPDEIPADEPRLKHDSLEHDRKIMDGLRASLESKESPSTPDSADQRTEPTP